MSESLNHISGGRTTPPEIKSVFALKDLMVGDFPTEVAPPTPRAFVHTTVTGVSPEADTIEFPWYWTRLNHPELNGNPNAVISVTPRGRLEDNHENHTTNLRQNPHPVGVVYREAIQRWYIYNLNLEPMARASFNVVVEERY